MQVGLAVHRPAAVEGHPPGGQYDGGAFLIWLADQTCRVVWGGAALWLFAQGETGWSIFMTVWGAVLISGVDNVVRPMLISRGSSLPFLLTLLGVLGGLIAFGFIGMFIGPVLLAVGYSLMSEWTGTEDPIVKHDEERIVE